MYVWEKEEENNDPTFTQVLQLYLEPTSCSVFIFFSIVQLQSLSSSASAVYGSL